MLNIKLVYIYILLFIIFTTFALTINVIISKNENILSNANRILLIAIIIMIILIFYNIYMYKPQNKILKAFDNKIHNENKLYNNKFIEKKIEKKIEKNVINDANYHNLLHSEYIDEIENENFYKSRDDYHNIEKYVHENYLTKVK